MKRIASILYMLVCGIYPMFCFEWFADWNSNVLIPAIPLVAIGSWIFGSTGGLLITLYIGYISFGLSQYFADEYIYYMDRITGLLMSCLVVYLMSHLRFNYDAIQETNRILDKRVAERDIELSTLTELLLTAAEKRRVSRGQELHDGIGQQLTGVQLLCSSLANQLEQEKNKDTAIAQTLISATHNAHDHIRQIARALFPVRIAQVGLGAALNELAGCITELRNIKVQIKELSDISLMSEDTALQLYRICQESLNHLIDHCHSDSFEISLNTSTTNYIMGITHPGSALKKEQNESLFELIQYRLNQINGSQRKSTTIEGRSIIYFDVPKSQRWLNR